VGTVLPVSRRRGPGPSGVGRRGEDEGDRHGADEGYRERPPGVGAEVLLCGRLGRRAVAMLADSGIDVYVGASGTVRDALALWRSGRLQPATVEGACQEHAHRGERGGGGHHHA
jgi:hypothetical protein